MKTLTFSLIFILLFAGCSGASNNQEPARQALVDFFDHLSSAQYTEAAKLYGGNYDVLRDYNPEVDPEDHAQLLQNGCQVNGFECLSVRNAEYVEQNGDMLVFSIWFSNPDGSLFVLGPCCGADETDQPPQSQFEYRVQRTGGEYMVLDLPVYVP